MKAHFYFLGTGSSLGVPMIGCECATCRSPHPKNHRLRPSGLVHVGNKKLLIDAGPDFRTQALRMALNRLDGLLLTHAHQDHVAGLDDLRAYVYLQKARLPCLLSHETFMELNQRFAYMFKPDGGSLYLEFEKLTEDNGSTDFCGITVHYLSYAQSGMKVTGFRIGDFAYVSDIRHYDDRVFHVLQGVKTLVLSALRHSPTIAHFSLEEGIAFSKQAGASQTYFTHIAHELEHEATNQSLPSGFTLAFDGQQITFDY